MLKRVGRGSLEEEEMENHQQVYITHHPSSIDLLKSPAPRFFFFYYSINKLGFYIELEGGGVDVSNVLLCTELPALLVT